jgi:methyltransferase (TIGR00027 family)
MEPTRASETAIDTAHVRALDHELLRPSLLADSIAASLLSQEERDSREAFAIETVKRRSPELADRPPQALLQIALERNASVVSLVLSRARYAEARLMEAIGRGVRQYVIIGAGLDSFAIRHPELRECLTVLEIDHPRSQADKRGRLHRAGLDLPANLHLGACDFETESIEAALGALPYDPATPAFFAWLGVTMYLERPTFDATLRSLHAFAAPDGELVFDYLDSRAMADHGEREGVRSNVERVRDLGEPVRGALDGGALPAELHDFGFGFVEDLGPAELEKLYFGRRTDGLHASEVGRLACYRLI